MGMLASGGARIALHESLPPGESIEAAGDAYLAGFGVREGISIGAGDPVVLMVRRLDGVGGESRD